jgi:hypothetical protein
VDTSVQSVDPRVANLVMLGMVHEFLANITPDDVVRYQLTQETKNELWRGYGERIYTDHASREDVERFVGMMFGHHYERITRRER